MVDAVDGTGLIVIALVLIGLSMVLFAVVRAAIISAMRAIRREDAAKSVSGRRAKV